MPEREDIVDVVLVGGGIMSATLAALITTLEPTWTVEIHERRAALAQESSNAWNNAGTGHAALCELNYTPERADGSIDIAKAVTINEQFELSRELWHHLATHDRLPGGDGFLSTTPHMTFVRGAENADYLRRRYETLRKHPLFSDLESAPTPSRSPAGHRCWWTTATPTSRSRRRARRPAPTWTSAGWPAP